MSKSFDPVAINKAIETLEAHPDFRVLRRLQPQAEYCPPDDTRKGLALIGDTETTGLDPETEKIFEIGYVLVEYGLRSGRIYRVVDSFSGLEDPGFPLTPEIEAITGVNYERDVKGKSLDRERIRADIARANLVIAHNSGFDRKFLEKEFPEFRDKPWLCSLEQGPWEAMGYTIRKQDYLLLMIAGRFYDAHRASTDAEALTFLLNLPGPDDRPILSHVLEKGRALSHTIWAVNSPFETKDVLKANQYKWCDGAAHGTFKAWHKTNVNDVEAELKFLGENVYPRGGKVQVDFVDPKDAFSGRFTSRNVMDVIVPGRAPAP